MFYRPFDRSMGLWIISEFWSKFKFWTFFGAFGVTGFQGQKRKRKQEVSVLVST